MKKTPNDPIDVHVGNRVRMAWMNEPINRRNVLRDMIGRTRASGRPADTLFQVVVAGGVLATMLFIFAVAGLIRW